MRARFDHFHTARRNGGGPACPVLEHVGITCGIEFWFAKGSDDVVAIQRDVVMARATG